MAFNHKKFELSPRLKLGIGRGYSQNQILKFAAIICLVLAVALTFNAVRLVWQSQKSPSSTNPQVLGATDVKPTGSQQTSASQNSIQFSTYTVAKGDTVFNISQKFNISWTTLAALNNLKSPYYLIKPGQILNVPKQ